MSPIFEQVPLVREIGLICFRVLRSKKRRSGPYPAYHAALAIILILSVWGILEDPRCAILLNAVYAN